MEAYATALSYAIPGFVFLVALEEIISRILGLRINRAFDTISSLSSGITNTLKSLLGLSVVIVSYEWMVGYMALFEPTGDLTWYWYVLAFIGLDFAGYWSHRFNHVVNVFWNRHIVHHSSEEFNLSCALRQSISSFVGIYFFLYVPMALVGVPAQVVALIAPIHFFAQFWYHTQLVGRMGWLEYVIVTPSHHRVHHAINPEYLDKNFSEIFILWDKLFGTFQEELSSVTPVYGTKKPVRTWNPIWINFMHIWLIAKDAWRTTKWWDKFRIWFMPTGWRPRDVAGQYPVEIVEDVYNRPKYVTEGPFLLTAWSWTQLAITLIIMYFILVNIDVLPFTMIAWIVTFLMTSIFSYTALMDGSRLALLADSFKIGTGVFLLHFYGFPADFDWFVDPDLIWAVGDAYLVLSLVLTFYFLQSQAIQQGPQSFPVSSK